MLLLISGSIASGKTAITSRLSNMGYAIVPTYTTCQNAAENSPETAYIGSSAYINQATVMTMPTEFSALVLPLSDEYHNALSGHSDAVLVVEPNNIEALKIKIQQQGYDLGNVATVLVDADYTTCSWRALERAGGAARLTQAEWHGLQLVREFGHNLFKMYDWDLVVDNNGKNFCKLNQIVRRIDNQFNSQTSKLLWAVG